MVVGDEPTTREEQAMYGRWGNDEYIDYRGPSYVPFDKDTRTEEEKEEHRQLLHTRYEEHNKIVASFNAGKGQYLKVGTVLVPFEITYMSHADPFSNCYEAQLEVYFPSGQKDYVSIYKHATASIDEPWTMKGE